MTDAPATREHPWPVALLSAKLKDYLDRLGTVWVEGEITQWGVSGGNVYGKLKDLEADATLSFTMWSSVRARLAEQFKQGDHAILLVKPSWWVKGGSLSMQVYDMKHVGLGDLLERLERLRAQLAAEGLFDAAPQEAPPVPARPSSASSPAATATPSKTCCATRGCAGRPSSSASAYAAVQGDRTAPEVVAAIRAPRRRPRGRGHHRRARRRRLPEPAGLQRRARRAGRRRGIHAHRLGDRPRGRPAAARRGRRPAGLDADGCREARRARRRRGARARRAGAGAPRHAPLRRCSPARSTASGTCGRGRPSPTPAGSSTAAPRSSPGGSRAAPSSSSAASSGRPRASASCAATCVRSRRRRRSTAATRSCRAHDGHVLRGPQGAPEGARLTLTLAEGALGRGLHRSPSHRDGAGRRRRIEWGHAPHHGCRRTQL